MMTSPIHTEHAGGWPPIDGGPNIAGKRHCLILFLLAVSSCHLLNAQPSWTPPCSVEWGPISQLSDTLECFAGALVPKIVSVDETLHMISWNCSLFYRRSIDAGLTWSPDLLLVHGDSLVGLYNRPLAAEGNSVYLVWGNNSPSGLVTSIKFRRSTDAGVSWLDEQILATSTQSPAFVAPMVGVKNNKVFFIMSKVLFSGDIQFFLTRSFDGGNTWDSLRQLTVGSIDHEYWGDIKITNTTAHLAFVRITSGPGREIAYMKSTDDGTTWSPEYLLSSADNYDRWMPQVSVEEENVWVSWEDSKYGGGFVGTILLRRSTDDGITWSDEVIVSPVGVAGDPSMTLDNGIAHITWTDERAGVSNSAIRYTMSSDGGLTWCDEMVVGDTLGIDGGQSIDSFNGRVHMVWSSWDSFPASVFYRQGTYETTDVKSNGNIVLSNSQAIVGAYPNPFNNEATVILRLKEPSRIRLALYDSIGREVLIKLNEVMTTGYHKVTLDTRRLSSGVYFVMLSMDGKTEARSLLLLK